ncbi:unnamed protein product [marine sediment metagenome]|uniref:Uncharacterized protein n=1 Tax=marine sediment metagenome TaxID=412755 RepID=X1GIU9_9ZZZZ
MKKHPFANLKKTLSKEEIELLERGIEHERGKIKKRFPFIITILGAFGVVSTYYGFEQILDKTFLVNYPWSMILIGIILLILTGALFKRL